jgi:opacity protein-like surface antigen
LLVGTPVKAGEMVLGIEAGMGVFGPSGVSTVDKLERDEIATSTVKGVYLGYQDNAWGGRWRIEGGVEHTDADGDWGVHQTNGDIARQTVQIAATSFKVGAAYDFKQTGDIFPFVGAGVSFNLNRPENSTIIELAGGGESGCVSDNSDTSSFGYYGKAGVGYDISDRVTMRAFYQYTDRGSAKTGCDGGPAGYEGYTVDLKDHSIRVSFGVRF